MSDSYEKFRKTILGYMGDIDAHRAREGKIEPTLGDYEAALAADTAIDPPVGDVDACVCFDSDGNPLNQCNECPR